MKKPIAYLLICLSTLSIFAQTELPKTVEQKLENYIKNNTPEKVYVQTDKPMYNVGEDIWFTAYLINGVNHQVSKKSKVVYTELLNAKDSIVSKQSLFVENMSVAGDFKIDEEWPAGNYTLRAYTNYLRNDSFDSYFQKEIPIYKIIKEEDKKETVVTPKDNKEHASTTSSIAKTPKITFYPEGGYLVDGLSSKVTFESTQKTEIFTGQLVDQDGHVINDITTVDRGLGMFMITPEVGKTYFVTGEIQGETIKVPLPKTLTKGYVLNLNNTRRGAILSMSSTTENGLQNTYIVAHQRGVLLYDNFETRAVSNNTIKIPTASLSDGVINFTLFDNNGHPVAERIAFINNVKNNIKLSIKSNKEVYSTREKVNVDLELTNAQGLKEYSFLSMSVRNLDACPHNKGAENIKTYLLLNSDLRGTIKNPGYFFEKDNDPKQNFVLDLVMMTNGWKRFTWQELLANQQKTISYEAEDGLYISGTTYDQKKKEKPIESVVRLTYMGKFMAQTPSQPTDKNGRFKFGPDIFPGSVAALVEARQESFLDVSKRSKNVHIVLDPPSESPEFDENKSIKTPQEIKEKQEANFIKVNQYVQQIKFEFDQKMEALEAVELEHKRLTQHEKRLKEMKSRTVYGQPDSFNNRIDVENLDYTPADIFQILENNPVITYDPVVNNFLWKRNNTETLIFLDDREIDSDFLNTITPEEISFIDILTGTSRNALTNSNKAIIVLYTNKNRKFVKDKNVEKGPGIVNFTREGFYLARKFYTPKQANEFEAIESSNTKTTLHWSPILVTTDKATTTTSFFTNDIETDYIIEVEGISIYGQPFYATKVISVE